MDRRSELLRVCSFPPCTSLCKPASLRMTDLESVQTWMPPSACTASNTAAISALVGPAAGPAMLAMRTV
eukprot:11263938-Alexandrium_andersonii.AAC.1